MNKNKLTLEKGNTETLIPSILPLDTTEQKIVFFSSSNENVATVNGDGEVTAVGSGTATITANCGGKTTTCQVTVKVPISGITLNKTTLTLYKGMNETLTATILPTDTTEDKTINWSSSDTSVITVTQQGELVPVGIGDAIITANCGGKTATCQVTVKVPIDSIRLNKSTLILEKGTTETLTATVLPTDTTENKTVTFSSSNPSIVTVTNTGVVTAVAPGTATITCMTNNGSGIKATCNITVQNTQQPVDQKDPTNPDYSDEDDEDDDEEEILEEGDVVSDEDSNGEYEVLSINEDGGTVEYVGNIESAKTVKIPNTITVNNKTYKVTSIGEDAFEKDTKLTKVTIGSNITSIGANAFYDCKKLTTVSIGKNVTKIGEKAFYKCVKLKTITIPSKVSSIGKQAFYSCKKLKTITIKTTKLTSKKVGSKAFKGIYSKATIKVPKKKLNTYKKLLKSKGVGSKAKIKK